GSARFMGEQNQDGGWGYSIGNPSSQNGMTCVGLLALAFGHGAGFDPSVEIKKKNVVNADPAIEKGFGAVSRFIGTPKKDMEEIPDESLYYLWSLERVAMLYNLKTIGGRDWYSWGAQMILHSQTPEGAFSGKSFAGATGPVNTCFALFFLRRSNLV